MRTIRIRETVPGGHCQVKPAWAATSVGLTVPQGLRYSAAAMIKRSPRSKKSAARNALYAQSGGVSAVINASACGVIETARKHRARIGAIYAGRDGIVGALTENLIDLSRE